MLKYVVLTLLLIASTATASYAQRSYSHTIRRSDGSRVTYRTTCSGSYARHCTTTVTERDGKRRSDVYTGPPLPDKKFCKAMRKDYGDNLERFAHPIGYNLSFCIADEALAQRIRDANTASRRAGGESQTMNPLYKPPQ